MGEAKSGTPGELAPLQYHLELVEYLKQEEPHVWHWATSAGALSQHTDEVREMMLRQTYRLEEDGHPGVFTACKLAMDRLRIDAPVSIYQAADGTMNAALYYVPGEIHLMFSGPTLERLDESELLALLGHELAHYKLWSEQSGVFYCASRILDLALSFPDAKPSHYETARLLSLHTELYADRGAAIAVGELNPAISMLVKVMTGLSSVDPAAYLRQAAELESSKAISAGRSHPESFLRAMALHLWWSGSTEIENWIEQKLLGPMSIEALDLLRQRELTRMTRGFLSHFVQHNSAAEDAVLTQVRSYFPEFAAGDATIDLGRLGPENIDDTTRDYLVALMFDCAMADPEITDEMMTFAAKTSLSIGAEDRFKAALKRDLKWSKPGIDGLFARAAKAA